MNDWDFLRRTAGGDEEPPPATERLAKVEFEQEEPTFEPSGNGRSRKDVETTLGIPHQGSLINLVHSLRTKLIIPYVILTLVTAMIGIFIVTRLVTSSIRERFANQLLEASRVAADGIVRRERVHLEQLRLMAFTQGVSEALQARDAATVEELLYPIVVNSNIHSVTAVDLDGQEILTLVQDPATGEYLSSRGADLSELDLVTKPLNREVDPLGDKFAGVAQTQYGPYLLTSAPVRTETSEVSGVLIIGTRLDALLAELKSQILADLVVLDLLGQPMVTTLARPEEGYGMLALTPYEIASLDPATTKEPSLYGRRYQVYYAPLLVRQEAVGVLGVVLPSNFIVTTEATSRNLFSLVFTLGTMAIIVVGYGLSQSIAKPLMRLRDISLAVAAGDLNQQTGLARKDEVGQLAAVFDLMTFRLRRRTEEAARLHEETRRRAEELAVANTRLQMAQQQLIQSEKLAAVGQLTAGIVHDVKNPLAVIRGLAEELEEDIGNNPRAGPNLSAIRENAARANQIVSDLLKFARQSEPEMKRQDICETVERSLRLTEYLARKGKVRVETDLKQAPIMVTYDAQQIEQVLVNLIQNAIQAMPHGGMLRVKVQQLDSRVKIIVQDTGVGIPKENLGRIFDPFFTTKPEGEGTGLGLSVSHGIIAQHHGQIDVESVVGRGTAFTIHLPVSPSLQGREVVAMESAKTSRGARR